LHCCTPGLVRTSAGSTPYKGTTSPIPIEPLLLLLLLLLLLYNLSSTVNFLTRVQNNFRSAADNIFTGHSKLEIYAI